MKRMLKFTAVLLLMIGALFAVTACGSSITRIDVENRNRPKVEYLLGEELDLTGGLLSIWRGDEKETLALDSSEINVSGYDKNTVGRQFLTVEYAGMTTTLTVTVISPLQVDGIPTDYFVGEPLDISKGTLIITGDGGNSTKVPLNSEGVTISGYDSSVANEALSVDITYEGEGETIEGVFVVAIHEIAEIRLTPPAKDTYQSHEEALSLSGGYLTLRNADKTLVKYVTLTEDMVSGFDLSAATEANLTEPLQQTLSVSYAGQAQTFNIRIFFSGVSFIRSCAEELALIDWSFGIPSIPAATGVRAVNAADMYFDLSRNDRNLIEESERDLVFRAAVVYGRVMWNDLLSNCSSVFAVSGDGEVVYAEGVTLAQVNSVLERLAAFETQGIAIESIVVSFGSTVLSGTITFEDYLGDIRAFEQANKELSFLIKLYQGLADFPSNWTEDTIRRDAELGQESVVLKALLVLLQSNMTTQAYRDLYGMITNWREDFFEIFYTYVWVTEDASTLNILNNVYQIRPFDTLVGSVEIAASAFLANYTSSASLPVDMTHFMLAYRDFVNMLAAWDASEKSARDAWIFENIKLTYSLGETTYSMTSLEWFEFVTLAETPVSYGGITYLFAGNQAVAAFWDIYLDTIAPILEDAGSNGITVSILQKYADDIEAMFRSFLQLSPAEQYLFLYSENTMYSATNNNASYNLMVPLSGSYYSYFGATVTEYYVSVVGTNAADAVYYLMRATELYARREYVGLSGFRSSMGSAISEYGHMGISDQMSFSTRMGFLYDRNKALYDRYDSSGNMTKTALGEWEDEFEAIRQQALRLNSAYVLINDNQTAQLAFMTAYEELQRMVDELLAKVPDNIAQAYYLEPFFIRIGKSNYSMSLDFVLNYFRTYYGRLLVFETYNGTQLLTLWDSDMQNFIRDISEFVWCTIEGTTYNGTVQDTLRIINSVRSLSAEQQYAIYALDGDYSCYRKAVSAFVQKNYADDVAALADLLLELEYAYAHYQHDPTYVFPNGQLYAGRIVELRTQMQAAYAALSAADKQAFDAAFGDMYTYYMEACKDIYDPSQVG